MKDILEADSIQISFNGRQILSDVYVKCEVGEVVGLLGRNGSGKSTLMKIIFGSQSAEYKMIRINKNFHKQKIHKSSEIAYLPQESFLPDIQVYKVIKLFLRQEDQRDEVMSHHIINKFLDLKTNELSGGQKRLLEFLLILNSNAKFLLLDEPFSAIEPLIKDEIKLLIKQYCNKKGFIITDHDYRHVLELADHLLLIVNGYCRHLSRPEELEFYNYVPLGTFNK